MPDIPEPKRVRPYVERRVNFDITDAEPVFEPQRGFVHDICGRDCTCRGWGCWPR